MKDVIVFGAIVDGVATRKDKTITLRIGTQELSPEKAGQLFGLQNAAIFVAIKVENFGQEEREALEAMKAEELEIGGGKTLSKRVRDVLFRLWQQKPDGYKDSNSHYAAQMEKIIQHYKNKLD